MRPEGGRLAPRSRRRPGAGLLTHPVRLVVLGFAVTVAVTALLLLAPVATESGRTTSPLVAVFTATGAASGALAVVDTGAHWTTFGEVVIMGAVQLGGLGFMTSASLLGLLVSRRLGVRIRLLTAAETQSFGLGDVRRVVRAVALVTFTVEAVIAAVLFLRLWLTYDRSPARAAYESVFHSITAFNNAGHSLYGDNLVGFAADPVIILTVAGGVILGGLGFPVLFELRHELRTPRYWSLHTRVTLLGYGILTVAGTIAVAATEWRNAATLGEHGVGDKLLAAFFASTTARTAGFNSIDYADADASTLVVTDVLMFIGGGSASTAGGIKITTFMILFYAILAEARGDETVDAFGRQISPAALRQALAVALLGVALLVVGTLCLLSASDHTLDQVLFEVTSAFGSVGLSTGITDELPAFGQCVLIMLMFIGRTGPIAVASALALRERRRLYRLPEERPIVG
ncbi:TrkH family potassium uptake protein [Parafrankia sp. BMG5.11]|uniref:TrkH family potassium uptake protein n=1 Tax=Parafrankia sp. BMG5.11 TaxID=222540 RepID=UPI00359FD1B7